MADHRVVPPYNSALNVQKLLPPALPHVCIPTTGSGSEVTPGAGLRAPDGNKWIFWHISMPPQVVLLDPEVAATTPVKIAAGSSMNSLAHAVEALYAANRQPVTDAFAVASIEKFGRWLPRLNSSPDDLEVRGEIQQAWLLGGMSICNARTALHHEPDWPCNSTSGSPEPQLRQTMLPSPQGVRSLRAHASSITTVSSPRWRWEDFGRWSVMSLCSPTPPSWGGSHSC